MKRFALFFFILIIFSISSPLVHATTSGLAPSPSLPESAIPTAPAMETPCEIIHQYEGICRDLRPGACASSNNPDQPEVRNKWWKYLNLCVNPALTPDSLQACLEGGGSLSTCLDPDRTSAECIQFLSLGETCHSTIVIYYPAPATQRVVSLAPPRVYAAPMVEQVWSLRPSTDSGSPSTPALLPEALRTVPRIFPLPISPAPTGEPSPSEGPTVPAIVNPGSAVPARSITSPALPAGVSAEASSSSAAAGEVLMEGGNGCSISREGSSVSPWASLIVFASAIFVLGIQRKRS